MIDRRTLDSIADVKRAFEQIGTEVATKVGVRANREAAKALRTGLIATAPYSVKQSAASLTYGHLRDNIKVRRQRARKQGNIVFRVTTGNAFWSIFGEYGTAHEPARPWFRPTTESMSAGLTNIQIAELRVGIDKAARAADRRTRRYGGVMPNGRNA